MLQNTFKFAQTLVGRKMQNCEKLIIVGSGPAAHTAAIYASRAELNPLLFEGFMAGGIAPGGQLTTTTEVENYPGFPDGINGPELMDKMRQQSVRYGTRILTETVSSIDLDRTTNNHGLFTVTTETGSVWYAQAIIVATGASATRLPIKGAGDGEYWQKGGAACAVCEGALPIFRDKPVVVVGGGDSAMEEATFLTKFASKVYIVHRRDELRATPVMQKRALANPKIEFIYSHVVSEVLGNSSLMEQVRIESCKTKESRLLAASGLFFAVGHKPNTSFLNPAQVPLDPQGYIVTEGGGVGPKTKIPGFFAAGDVYDKIYRQAIVAAGSGCMAAMEAEKFLCH